MARHRLGHATLVIMSHPAGVQWHFASLERRRPKAARLLAQGVAQAEVARGVGVNRQSVSRWVRQLAQTGRVGLRRAPRVGRSPRLSEADRRRIVVRLKWGPEALGYATGLWTARRVADLIARVRGGVTCSAGHVWQRLRQLGCSCQRPTGRTLERDEAAMR